MLYKLWRAVAKEVQLLLRDWGGLIIIFLMPLLLIITITLIQQSTFKDFNDTKIPIILVDYDKGEVSKSIIKNIEETKTFEIVKKSFNEEETRRAVFRGDYELGIIIPANLSSALDANINLQVEEIVSQLGVSVDTVASKPAPPKSENIKLYFDPAINLSFKNGVKNSIDKMVFQIENEKIYTAFEEQLGADGSNLRNGKLINFQEITPSGNIAVKPNSVQHNVPAWALFAIFMVVIPLSINLVKEKTQGTAVRLHTSPTSYLVHIFGKTVAYLIICLVQFFLMLAVGVYIFPLLGLNQFNVSGKMLYLLTVTFFAGLAAIGFGTLIGTLSKTQEQSAPFGATAVVILAALGGIWVPVFMMPDFMQKISRFSPMNWGLEAYYDVILRDAKLPQLVPELILMLGFYGLMVLAAYLYDKRKNDI